MTYDPENKWEIDTPDEADDCSYCDDHITRSFILTPEVLAITRLLCKEVKREWQVILTGKETEDGIYADGYYIPKQETTCATVINQDDISKEFLEGISAIGTCHSHNNMPVGFSHTDEVCTNFSFLKHHIVTNNDGKFKAISRVELPCGLVKMADAIVQVESPIVSVNDLVGFDNIKEREYKPITTYHAGSYGTCGEQVNWKRGNKRNHAFGYNQDGGFYNA